jgi:hypothetical protein
MLIGCDASKYGDIDGSAAIGRSGPGQPGDPAREHNDRRHAGGEVEYERKSLSCKM